MPIVGSIKEMDKRIFNDGKMGIRDEIMQIFKR
jgi:acyl CoA:acetate/3-ketoacid CoA transferase